MHCLLSKLPDSIQRWLPVSKRDAKPPTVAHANRQDLLTTFTTTLRAVFRCCNIICDPFNMCYAATHGGNTNC